MPSARATCDWRLVPSQREIDAYIKGFESVTIELRGYGLTDSERDELIRDAKEELSR